MRGLERYEGAPIERIRGATRQALQNLVELAIRESVDFVLIAGDLYDGDWTDYETGLFFVGQAARLNAANIPLFLISGNHDAANRMTRSLPLPDNVRLFSSKQPETALLPDINVAIHGQSFATAAVLEDLSQNYPAALDGQFNIGLLHTSADGREGHDSYAPCSIGGLQLKGYDYWALGHIHKREVLNEKPFIAFSGNIQGRHIRETGPRGCLLVTVDDDRSIHAELVPLDVMRWEVATVDVQSAAESLDVLELVREAMEELQRDADSLLLAVRVELIGATELHGELLADREHWTNQIRGLAVQLTQSELWIEKVKIQTTEPIDNQAAGAIDDDAWSVLSNLFEGLQDNPDAWSEIGFEFDSIAKMLPGELKVLAGAGPEEHEWLQGVTAEAHSLLLHRLRHGSDVENS